MGHVDLEHIHMAMGFIHSLPSRAHTSGSSFFLDFIITLLIPTSGCGYFLFFPLYYFLCSGGFLWVR